MITGVQSAFTYAGARTLREIHEQAVVGVQTQAGYWRRHAPRSGPALRRLLRRRATIEACLLVMVVSTAEAHGAEAAGEGVGEAEDASSEETAEEVAEDEEYPVDAVLSRRHIAFGMGGGPIVFGSILDDTHHVGSHVGGLVNLGFGEHVDVRGGVYAGPSGSARGLFLPLGLDVELRFGHTMRPFSAGFAVGVGYLFAPEPSNVDRWAPDDGLYVRPQVIPMALQLSRFEVELCVGVDFVEQRLLDRSRFGLAYVSTGLRFYFVGYETHDVVLK
jgi:hypothetical protein